MPNSSEAVCVLSIEGGGSIRFVDLAGSERNYETRFMTAQQHRDFAEINKSLMALKVGSQLTYCFADMLAVDTLQTCEHHCR